MGIFKVAPGATQFSTKFHSVWSNFFYFVEISLGGTKQKISQKILLHKSRKPKIGQEVNNFWIEKKGRYVRRNFRCKIEKWVEKGIKKMGKNDPNPFLMALRRGWTKQKIRCRNVGFLNGENGK